MDRLAKNPHTIKLSRSMRPTDGCRLFHKWAWKQGIGHSGGCSLTGTCVRCGKTKYIPFEGWMSSRVKNAEPMHPLQILDAPPPPPRRPQLENNK